MNTMIGCPEEDKIKFNHTVKMWTAGAPPPPALIQRFTNEFNIQVQTVYGLTETYGPISSHVQDASWGNQNLTGDELLEKCTYQSHDVTLEDMRVLDPVTLKEVPPDGKTMGEVMIRGNIVMKGYLSNETATDECFSGGI